MTTPVVAALHILSHFWLKEIESDDAEIIAALPELAQTLPSFEPAILTELAVEYQRLFGFNLPPYESVFVDPSTMLMAPATRRVQVLYQQGGWHPPREARTGAPDHLGLELLALASALEISQIDPSVLSANNRSKEEILAHRLHTRHLALWVPPFVLALGRLTPHPFYAALGDLTLDLILSTLPDQPIPDNSDPFPDLPQPPIYKGTEDLAGPSLSDETGDSLRSPSPLFTSQHLIKGEDSEVSLRDIIKQLLPPCKTGLFLTREDIAGIGQALNSPGVMGERYRMLETLFRFAGQYGLIPKLFDQLTRILVEAEAAYQNWVAEYPAWTPYANAWQHRLASTQVMLEELKQVVTSDGATI